jgi:hypothetical protein
MMMGKYVGNDVGKGMFMQIVKIAQKEGCRLALLEGENCIGVNWIIPNWNLFNPFSNKKSWKGAFLNLHLFKRNQTPYP